MFFMALLMNKSNGIFLAGSLSGVGIGLLLSRMITDLDLLTPFSMIGGGVFITIGILIKRRLDRKTDSGVHRGGPPFVDRDSKGTRN